MEDALACYPSDHESAYRCNLDFAPYGRIEPQGYDLCGKTDGRGRGGPGSCREKGLHEQESENASVGRSHGRSGGESRGHGQEDRLPSAVRANDHDPLVLASVAPSFPSSLASSLSYPSWRA